MVYGKVSCAKAMLRARYLKNDIKNYKDMEDSE